MHPNWYSYIGGKREKLSNQYYTWNYVQLGYDLIGPLEAWIVCSGNCSCSVWISKKKQFAISSWPKTAQSKSDLGPLAKLHVDWNPLNKIKTNDQPNSVIPEVLQQLTNIDIQATKLTKDMTTIQSKQIQYPCMAQVGFNQCHLKWEERKTAHDANKIVEFIVSGQVACSWV